MRRLLVKDLEYRGICSSTRDTGSKERQFIYAVEKADRFIAMSAIHASSDPRVLSSSGPWPEWKRLYMPQVDDQKVETAKLALQGILYKMESLGAVIVDPANVNSQLIIDFGYKAVNIVYNTEGKEGFSKYLDGLASTDMKNLQDVIE
jgi:hypothetical protein